MAQLNVELVLRPATMACREHASPTSPARHGLLALVEALEVPRGFSGHGAPSFRWYLTVYVGFMARHTRIGDGGELAFDEKAFLADFGEPQPQDAGLLSFALSSALNQPHGPRFILAALLCVIQPSTLSDPAFEKVTRVFLSSRPYPGSVALQLFNDWKPYFKAAKEAAVRS
jgi:hypothetical protein